MTEPPVRPRRPGVRDFRTMKVEGRPIAVLTCYDALMAGILEAEGVDMILVGDSLGQVVLGHDSTLPVTVDDMIRHAGAVCRGAPNSFVVVDLPFLSYQTSAGDALRNAGRILKETGAQAVKLEGGDARSVTTVERLVTAGIPVQGHLGLTPQSVHALGGYRVQGREPRAAAQLLEAARNLEEAGCFSLVLELVPGPLAMRVRDALDIPVIGIGAGAGCDGQVLVLPDALGLNPGFTPRFLKRFSNLHEEASKGVRAYVDEVRGGTFPAAEHTFDVPPEPDAKPDSGQGEADPA